MATVLLIEDDPSQRFIAAYALKKVGHKVYEAADGRLGVRMAQEVKPEVIVCDVMMPGMTGYEVLETLRKQEEFAAIPVILCTAMSDRQHMRQGMMAGATDYLTKPYRPEELCDAVAAGLVRSMNQQQAFMRTMSDVVVGALEQQKEQLGRQYESRLEQELNARWTRKANASGDLLYPIAVLLLVEMLPPAGVPDEALAEAVKRNLQQARDTLYVFGADHVVPYGSDLLAVFAGDEASVSTPVEARAARAAFALVKAAPKDRPISVALHHGAVTLVSVTDGLHGDQGHTVVPSDTVTGLASLREFAKAAGWRVACTPVLAHRLKDYVILGRKQTTMRGEPAVELSGVTAAR